MSVQSKNEELLRLTPPASGRHLKEDGTVVNLADLAERVANAVNDAGLVDALMHGLDANGDPEAVAVTAGAGHNYDQSQKLTQGLLDSDGNPKTVVTTAFPRHLQDVNAYALHTTGGVVVAGDLAEFSWTETDVDGIVVDCWGGASFMGMYLTLAQTDIGVDAAALRLASSNVGGVGGTVDRSRIWVPKSITPKFIPFQGLQFGWAIAIDTDAAEDNNIEIIPV